MISTKCHRSGAKQIAASAKGFAEAALRAILNLQQQHLDAREILYRWLILIGTLASLSVVGDAQGWTWAVAFHDWLHDRM